MVYYAQDTQVLTTFFVTTTIPAGAVPYTSIFTDAKSAAITEVIGVTAASTPTGAPISPVPSSGLSSGAKIGIGVAIPLVFIGLSIIAILFFLRHRKVGQQAERPERHDGGLPEPTSTISILKESGDHPPSYQSPQVEVGGAPIAEMHQDQQPLGMVGKPESTSHELNADEQKPPLDGNPAPPSHELTSDQQPMRQAEVQYTRATNCLLSRRILHWTLPLLYRHEIRPLLPVLHHSLRLGMQAPLPTMRKS